MPWSIVGWITVIVFFLCVFNTMFVSSHMYPENPEGTQVIVGSMNMGYISDTARNRTHNLFCPKREPISLGHSDMTGVCLGFLSSSYRQSVLNYAARLVFGLKRFDYITPALMDLHWLPYPQRITYKLCMIMFKCLRCSALLILLTIALVLHWCLVDRI